MHKINNTVYEAYLAKVIQLYDDVWYRVANLEIRDQCNTGFIALDNSVAFIDYPEQHPDEELIAEAEKITGKPVKYILLTHAHCDHVTGFHTLRRNDISLIARKSTIENLRAEGYPVPDVYKEVTKDIVLELDGFTFKLELPGGTAHSPWDMLIGVPKYKLVFTGDMIVRPKYMFFHSSRISGWKYMVEILKTRDWEHFVMGHGMVQDKEYLNEIGHYLHLLSSIKEILSRKPQYIDEQTILSNPPTLPPELVSL